LFDDIKSADNLYIPSFSPPIWTCQNKIFDNLTRKDIQVS
jgi:hypothetical protein